MDPCHHSAIQFDPGTIKRSVSKLTFLLPAAVCSCWENTRIHHSKNVNFARKSFNFLSRYDRALPHCTGLVHLILTGPAVNCASRSLARGKAGQHQKSIINIPTLLRSRGDDDGAVFGEQSAEHGRHAAPRRPERSALRS